VINLDSILTVAKVSLQEYITTLTPEKLRAVEAAIHFAFGLEE
jgi:mRNA-degrading endonuclease toxin of MazEF toxin-antitoxin module